ncbi:LysM peptidoglycan-binding domain-containing protein, partial [Micromonospora sediminimaris]|uniref:LysM peptidoglycan-binding domain-containing protein n=1 Tax=Micromonospora sediminimaris TaxID=547162 RepID=UPI001951A38D
MPRSAAAATVVATGGAVLIAAAPPVTLFLTGWFSITAPAPEQLRAWLQQPLTTGFVAALFQFSAWLLWTLLASIVSRRVYHHMARRIRWRFALRLPSPLQGLTAAFLGATAVTTTAAVPAVAHTTSSADAVPPDIPAQPADDLVEDEESGEPATSTYTVRRGDTLSAIADRFLDDPDRWPEIYNLNRGTRYPQIGGTLTDPNLIRPGWTLDLPEAAAETPSPPPPPARPSPTSPSTPDNPPPQDHCAAAPSPTQPHTPNQPAPTSAASPHATPGTASPAPGSAVAPSTPATPDPDSVIEPPPATTPSAATTSPTTTPAPSSTTPTASPTSEDRPNDDNPGVSLPGGWAPIGLATALAAAASVLWLRRRSHYNPITDPDPANDPTLQPLPAVISRLRRAAREQAPDLVTSPAPQPTVRDIAEGTPPPPTPTGPSGPQLAGLPEHPADGLGLTGAGGPDAIRAMLVATLSSGSPDDPDARGHIVIPATALADLIGGNNITDLVGAIPRLHVAAGLDHALAHIEAQIIHRTRAVTDADVTNLDDLHQADPHHEPLPPIILITHVP